MPVKYPGSEPDSSNFSIPASGILAVPSQYGFRFHDYASRSITVTNGDFDDCTFDLSGGYTYGASTTDFDGGALNLPDDAATLTQGTSILPVTLAAQTASISSGSDSTDDLTVADASIFPPRFGYFEIEADPNPNNIYRYERINTSTNTLEDITVVKAPWESDVSYSFNVEAGATKVIAHTSTGIRSIGTYGAGGPLENSAVYERFSLLGFIPGVLGSGGGFTFIDRGDNLDYWNTVDSVARDKVGIKNVDGDTLINLYGSGPQHPDPQLGQRQHPGAEFL